ncbi:MAG TPA: pentapeptide repeat-containing protein [Clostridia bacterium]
MNREEALQHFKETYVSKKCNEKLFALEEFYQKNINELIPGLVEAFRQICIKAKKMQQENKKGKIGYITFSMLRTSIAEGKHKCLVEAFDGSWFLDFQECSTEYDASWAFKFLDELGTELEEKRRMYAGSITASDLERIKLLEAQKFNSYVISLARYVTPKMDVLKEYQELSKEDEFEIRAGEYHDYTETVFKEDMRKKDRVKIVEWLGEKKDEYAFEVFRSLDLSEGDYAGIDFSFADLRNSNLSKSNLNGSELIGTRFNNCILDRANISVSFIYGADFSGCSLKYTDFFWVQGNKGISKDGEWECPGYFNVNFTDADLEGADFERADLKGAVFIGANLKGTRFDGANLENAIFSWKDKGILKLDQEQMKVIQWKR